MAVITRSQARRQLKGKSKANPSSPSLPPSPPSSSSGSSSFFCPPDRPPSPPSTPDKPRRGGSKRKELAESSPPPAKRRRSGVNFVPDINVRFYDMDDVVTANTSNSKKRGFKEVDDDQPGHILPCLSKPPFGDITDSYRERGGGILAPLPTIDDRSFINQGEAIDNFNHDKLRSIFWSNCCGVNKKDIQSGRVNTCPSYNTVDEVTMKNTLKNRRAAFIRQSCSTKSNIRFSLLSGVPRPKKSKSKVPRLNSARPSFFTSSSPIPARSKSSLPLSLSSPSSTAASTPTSSTSSSTSSSSSSSSSTTVTEPSSSDLSSSSS